MTLLLLCFSAGIAVAQWQASVPLASLVWLTAAAALGAVLLALALVLAAPPGRPLLGSAGTGLALRGLRGLAARTGAGALRRRELAFMLLLIAALLAGQAWSSWRMRMRADQRLDAALEGQPLELRGWIDDLPQPVHSGTRLSLTSDPQGYRPGIPPRWSVLVPAALLHGRPPLAGDCLELRAVLQRPHGQLNFAGFDADAWAWSNGLLASGRAQAVHRCTDPRPDWNACLQRLRDHIRARLQDTLGPRPAAAIVVALVVGDQGGISQDQWTLLWRSGIGHLVSISGSHVTILAGLLAWVCERAWRTSARACRKLPARHAGALAGLVAALAYALVAGFAVPTRRTVFMLAGAGLCALHGLRPSALRVLALAAAATLAADPFAALSPSFWLTFCAVAGLILAGYGRLHALHGWRAEFAAQWVSNLSLLPLVALWFGQLSLVAPLANLVAIPLVGMVVTPLALVSMFPGLHALAVPAEVLLEWLLALLAWLATPSWAAVALAAPSASALLLAGLAVLLLLQGSSRWPGAGWALPALLPLCFPSAAVADGAVRVEVTDVGQGLAVLVRTHHHCLLFDSGPRWPGGDAGARTLVPLLRAEGVARLDRMVLSHPDADHVGGADSLLASLPIAEVDSGFLREGARPCLAGEAWVWDGVHFEFLHPPDPAQAAQSAHERNDHACVLRVAAAGHAVLLPADIEAPVERSLLADPQRAAQLRSEVVVVPHHGSHTSSTAEFIAATQARWALVSLGWHNRYHHPDPQVVERWQAAGARVLRTDLAGALRVDIDATGVAVALAREQRLAAWRGPPVP